MTENIRKVLSFPQPVPAKADYQRVKSTYSIREIKQMFGLSERTVRRWTDVGIIYGAPAGDTGEVTYDFQALTMFRRVRDMRSQGLTIKQIEAELQGQMSLFRQDVAQVQLSRLLTPFEEALVLHEQGDLTAADFYQQAITEGDNIAEAYCNLGIIELDRGNTIAALENFTQSLKNDPRHVEAHYNLANLYYDAGDFPLARLHYEAAVQIEPNFALVYYNLALVYHRLNNATGARHALNKYKELEPGDEEIELVDQLLKAMETGRPNG
ncbi:MAG TPA: tetratricopeptide repeat protein [Pyrinomonadaceae bacterium]|jgi:tetratricopeptide (TPR) repeat protein|nr:tetratricopeptide repeat protein [Pyrinomonadaceae bacterium]